MHRLTLGWIGLGVAWAAVISLDDLLPDRAADVLTGLLAALTAVCAVRLVDRRDKALLLRALVDSRLDPAPVMYVNGDRPAPAGSGPRHARQG